MKKQFYTNFTTLTALCAAVTMIAITTPAHAEDVELPTPTEVQYYSPEAQQFYSAGIAALDTADYDNSYSLLTKAAALQPASINLNRITGKIAMYQGRQHPAVEARDYYETAIHSFENILLVPTLNPDIRRQVINELKTAQQERDNLAQRDVAREATGTAFALDYNRRYADIPARDAGLPPAPNSLTTLTQTQVDPSTLLKAAFKGQGQGGQPGYGQPGAFPGGQPGYGQPGVMQPGQPGGPPII